MKVITCLVKVITCLGVRRRRSQRLPPATLKTTPTTLHTNVRNRTIPGILTPLR